MKKIIRNLAALVMAAVLTVPCALAEDQAISMSGSLQPSDIRTITAPMTGSVLELGVRAGDRIEKGEQMMRLDTVRIYAPCDGVVAGLRAEEGDSLSVVQAMYGAAMYVEPQSEYMIYATTTNAHDSNDNRMIHVGETVYLTSINNYSRTGEGIITYVDGESYTVEVLDGNLRLAETCRVSRDDDNSEEEGRIGQGKTVRNNPIAIAAEGSVVKLHVREGDQVRKGELLMEIAPDRLDGKTESSVLANSDYVVVSVLTGEGSAVQKGQPVANVFEAGTLCAVVQVDEEDLLSIKVGDRVTVMLDIDPDEYVYEGEIESISYVPSEQAMGVAYDVTVTFENDELVRMGMSVTVETDK